MKLDGRLKLIVESIPQCSILADIGTDHAYIPIHAVRQGRCERAVAADLRKGPIRMAQANITRLGLQDVIETRLGDGLEPVGVGECDVIVIAGMGGPLIKRILSDSLEKAQKARKLLLQANNAVDALRRWLYQNGFEISSEKLAEDSGKLYCLIEAVWTGKSIFPGDFACYIGEKVFIGNDTLLESYLSKKLSELNTIITGRARSDPNKLRRIEEETSMDTETCTMIRDRLVKHLEDRKSGRDTQP
jgi:tRNA (adenine22-N1)-methyltransferase